MSGPPFRYWQCPVDGAMISGATPELLEERVEEHEAHLHGIPSARYRTWGW